ncbi:CYTH domain-containing protein [Planococcus shenhongbingii]|uniref:CYTH domain-containing protein n=1 Tax=Planococcus shenhongbingii TaxID=3058398 RepID=A0ABT8N914_9BACL|nr:CYTH domain-containing protein [Planococcus sp. N017]MDN7244390.1 CYTH domain-containing protein [Planococcus sp. N017]
MTKELEIEFKNMLTREEYKRLLTHFHLAADDAKTQENYYFDTADFKLKEAKCALRIRKKLESFECTLKIPAPEGNFEITDPLNALQAEAIISGQSFEAAEVYAALQKLQVEPSQLIMIGKLMTHRIELSYKDGLLVLDHSEYQNTADYEVEFEVQDAKLGQQQFLEFLQLQKIPVRPADKKIARFMKAAKSGI